MGCSISLCFVMMLWTARAKLSVPPPGPAVAMNSIGLTGCQAAFAAPGRQAARPKAITANFGFTVILSSTDFVSSTFLFLVLASVDRVLHEACAGHGAFLLQRCNFFGVKTVSRQDRGGVLAIQGCTASHL